MKGKEYISEIKVDHTAVKSFEHLKENTNGSYYKICFNYCKSKLCQNCVISYCKLPIHRNLVIVDHIDNMKLIQLLNIF